MRAKKMTIAAAITRGILDAGGKVGSIAEIFATYDIQGFKGLGLSMANFIQKDHIQVTPSPDGDIHSPNIYTLTPKAEKIVKNIPSELAKQRIQQWVIDSRQSRTKLRDNPRPASASRRFGRTASTAIQSIAQVVDENERLVASLRTLRSQIDNILAGLENGGD